MKPTRRTILQWMTALGGSIPGIGPLLARPAGERAVLEAACARILPSDDGPGAREANAVEYIVRSLAGRYHKPLRRLFREGTRRLDSFARETWGKGYVELPLADQDRALKFIGAGFKDGRGFRGAHFLHRLLELTLEGFLGDPKHGGNRHGVGWRYIRYTPGCPRSHK